MNTNAMKPDSMAKKQGIYFHQLTSFTSVHQYPQCRNPKTPQGCNIGLFERIVE